MLFVKFKCGGGRKCGRGFFGFFLLLEFCVFYRILEVFAKVKNS